jgi:hypothetical protein
MRAVLFNGRVVTLFGEPFFRSGAAAMESRRSRRSKNMSQEWVRATVIGIVDWREYGRGFAYRVRVDDPHAANTEWAATANTIRAVNAQPVVRAFTAQIAVGKAAQLVIDGRQKFIQSLLLSITAFFKPAFSKQGQAVFPKEWKTLSIGSLDGTRIRRIERIQSA